MDFILNHVLSRNFAIARQLITNENVNGTHTVTDCSALHFCAFYGDDDESLDFLQWLLTLKVNLELLSVIGYTALKYAFLRNNRRKAVLLMQAGANIHHTDINEHTCLCHSLNLRWYEVADILLTKGAWIHKCCPLVDETSLRFINRRESFKNTSATWISAASHGNVRRIIGKDMIRLVARHVKRLNFGTIKTEKDKGWIFMTEFSTIKDEILSGNYEIPKTLITVENVNRITQHGMHLLHYCALYCRDEKGIEFLKWILKFDVDVDMGAEGIGNTPLLISCLRRNYVAMNFFIDHGANVHHCNEYGHSCICYAMENGNFKLADTLLTIGAVPHARCYYENTRTIHYLRCRESFKNIPAIWILVAAQGNVRRIIGKDMIRLVAQATWDERHKTF